MDDRERIRIISHRIEKLDRMSVASWEESIRAIARAALEAELTDLGRRVYGHRPRPVDEERCAEVNVR